MIAQLILMNNLQYFYTHVLLFISMYGPILLLILVAYIYKINIKL